MFVETMPDDVTWFSSSQQGAPQMMGGSNGDMLKVLDACMIDGFGEAEATSVTKDLDETTIDFGVGHGYLSRQKVLISGAEDPLLNGTHKIRSLTATSITIYTPAVTSIAGTIVVKVSPLGWESIFGKTDPLKRAYRSLSPTNSKRVLYLDMDYPESPTGYHATSPAKRATVSVCQDMQVLGEQIGSLTDGFNNFTTSPNGSLFWYQKRDSSKTTAVTNTPSVWTIVGNSDFLYFIVGWSSVAAINSKPVCDVFGFGEYVGLYDDPGDKTFVMAAYNNNDIQTGSIGELGAYLWGDGVYGAISTWVVVDGVLTNQRMSIVGGPKSMTFFSGANSFNYPNPKGNALFTMPLRVGASHLELIYGFMPSINFIENKIVGPAYNGTIVDDLLLVSVAKLKNNNENYGYYAFYIGE